MKLIIDKGLFVDYPDVLEVKDLQKMLQIGRNTALRLLSNGDIKSFRIGNRYKVLKTSVIEYICLQLSY